jgi:DNA-directed RNA polymerase subunit RPC12/RpoP
MLIKCKECQKDVSSEAANCPHCGFPIKPQPKAEDIPIVREANSSKSGLGTFFILLGIVGIVIGFVVIQPTEVEGLQGQVVSVGHQYGLADNGNEGMLGGMISDRRMKAACFFIPAGILFVLGLVLKSSGKPTI